MTEEDWTGLKFFRRTENWGNPDKMEKWFLYELDAYREHIGTAILVTCGTGGIHVKGSQHYIGQAADIMFPGKSRAELFDLYMAATRFKFGGIGLYPNWKLEGKELGGLHLDWRQAPVKALWLGAEVNGTQKYLALNTENLRKYGLV
jgi:hypothetical protein